MISIKKIYLTSRTEYSKWITNPRMIIMGTIIIFIFSFVVKPLNSAAIQMSTPLNIFEPYIAVINSGVILLIMPIAFMVLISDFPRTDGNTLFSIIRTGRINWLLGQMLFLLYVSLTYIFVIFITSTIPIILNSYVYDGWSLTATEYRHFFAMGDSYVSKLIPENLYMQLTPYETVIHSTILIFLQLVLLGFILLLFKIIKYKFGGMLTGGALIAVGITFCSINSRLMWLFPSVNSIVWLHYTKYYREEVTPLYYSYLYFLILIIGLFIACTIQIKKYSYDSLEDIE